LYSGYFLCSDGARRSCQEGKLANTRRESKTVITGWKRRNGAHGNRMPSAHARPRAMASGPALLSGKWEGTQLLLWNNDGRTT